MTASRTRRRVPEVTDVLDDYLDALTAQIAGMLER